MIDATKFVVVCGHRLLERHQCILYVYSWMAMEKTKQHLQNGARQERGRVLRTIGSIAFSTWLHICTRNYRIFYLHTYMHTFLHLQWLYISMPLFHWQSIKLLPRSSKGCWMDDKGCRKTPSLKVRTAPFGRCWYVYIIWSNYSDLTRPHPKWWFSKGNPLISGTSRFVKYYNLARLVKYCKPNIPYL